MQAQTPEVSGDKAITPAAELRLVSVEQLKKIHRDLDACQKVIWLAGCQPRVSNGFDPSYVNDAQARLKEIDDILNAQSAPGGTFTAALKDVRDTALRVFKDSHDDASEAIEYMTALLLVSELAKIPEESPGYDEVLYRDALTFVIQNQRASISILQRRFAINYHSAARLIEALEKAGVVSGMNSDGARTVLMLEVPNA